MCTPALCQPSLNIVFPGRRETLLYLEKGKYNPSLKLAHDITKTLKATIDELFVFEDEDDNMEYREKGEK